MPTERIMLLSSLLEQPLTLKIDMNVAHFSRPFCPCFCAHKKLNIKIHAVQLTEKEMKMEYAKANELERFDNRTMIIGL